METRVLRYFLTVAREGSITRAAELLHVTQPTLSRQLTALEEETGVTLFLRGARRITLTPEGQLLRRRAEQILELMDKTELDLKSQTGEPEGLITIGSGEVASTRILSEICTEFRRRHPLVQFEIFTAASDVIQERMERGLIDVGLLLEPVDMSRFDFIRLPTRETWTVLMRADDPLAEKDSLTARDLRGLPLGLPSRKPVLTDLANWFGSDFDRLNVAFYSNLPGNAANLVQQGMGYFLCIHDNLDFQDGHPIVSRPLSPEISSSCALAWRRNQLAGNAAARFIEFIPCFLGMEKADM